jgi:Zn-dependent protease
MPDFADAILWYIVFLYSTVCHEAAHAWTAWRLGDDTAYRGGQVSLDPLPHIRREPLGMVVVPVLLFLVNPGFMLGWASAPYDPQWALRYPRRSALMALAGPATNLALVLVAALLLRVGMEWHVWEEPYSAAPAHLAEATAGGLFPWLAKLVSIVFSLNLLLFIFNLLPLPPLDGSSFPLLLLSGRTAQGYMEFLASPGLRIFGLVIAWKGFPYIYEPVRGMAVSALYLGVN